MSENSIQLKVLPTLREGFTTGTCATGAMIAAMWLMYLGKVPKSLSVPLPPFQLHGKALPLHEHEIKWLDLSASKVGYGPAFASDLELLQSSDFKNSFSSFSMLSHASIIKDGGDDPDVTHGLAIYVTLIAFQDKSRLCPLPYSNDFLQIIAGAGIGMVTRPGLPVPPGEAAINPAPRSQLLYAASFYFKKFMELAPASPAIYPPFAIIINVPGGAQIAEQTLNPKLGIRGGISILGTRGIVRPFSNKAWEDTIIQEISVAKASGQKHICLSTGRRSEDFLKSVYPCLPEAAFVQAGDMAAFALSHAAKAGFRHIVWGCFFGKLCKLAQGLENTHAYREPLDLDQLANICLSENAIHAERIRHCNTAREALKIICQEKNSRAIIKKIMFLAKNKLEEYANHTVTLHLFQEDGRELGSL